MPKIKPCKKCGSTNILLWDCGYSSFNPGGGECLACGFRIEGEAGCSPGQDDLIAIWNEGQKPDKLKAERLKTRRLRAQLRENGLEPVA